MKTIFKIISLFFTILLTSCNGVTGNGNTTTEKRNINELFDKIKIQQGLHLTLSSNSTPSIEVETDENLQELIITEIKNNTLNIYTKKSISFASSKKINVAIPEIQYLSASSGSLIKSQNVITSDVLQIESSSGSNINITTNTNHLTLNVNSGAQIYIEGKTDILVASVNSGSSLKAKNLISNNVNLTTSSGASANVFVNTELSVNANSGSSVNYYGNPFLKDHKTNSGASLNHKK